MKSLINSFKYAFSGLGFVIYNEKNMRIHICTALYVTYFSRFYNFSDEKYILLFLTIGMLLFAEITNTAIEFVVNLQSRKFNIYAKIAKDVSAGAVLTCAFISCVIGFILFFDIQTISNIFEYFRGNIISSLLFALSIVLSYIFIFIYGNRTKKTGGSI